MVVVGGKGGGEGKQKSRNNKFKTITISNIIKMTYIYNTITHNSMIFFKDNK